MIFLSDIELTSRSPSEWIDITEMVVAKIRESGITAGFITVTSLHTTAAITINENADPDVSHDFFAKLAEMVPADEPYYRHGEGNSHAHVKTALIGTSVTCTVENGDLRRGIWQSIYFCEFDGPRSSRTCSVSIIGE